MVFLLSIFLFSYSIVTSTERSDSAAQKFRLAAPLKQAVRLEGWRARTYNTIAGSIAWYLILLDSYDRDQRKKSIKVKKVDSSSRIKKCCTPEL